MNWIFLVLGGIFEVGFTFCMGKGNEANGLVSYLWYMGFVLCLIISMLLLIKATQGIPLGTAYAIWTGIGAVGTVLVGIFVFKEPVNLYRMLFIITLIGSIIGLKVVSAP